MLLRSNFLLLSTIFCYLMLDFYVKREIRFSLRDKRLFKITKVEITRVDCISIISFNIFTIKVVSQPTLKVIYSFSLLGLNDICKQQLTSLLVSCVSCLSQWARRNFPALLKKKKNKLCLIGKKNGYNSN